MASNCSSAFIFSDRAGKISNEMSGTREFTSWTKTRAARSRASVSASHWCEIRNFFAGGVTGAALVPLSTKICSMESKSVFADSLDSRYLRHGGGIGDTQPALIFIIGDRANVCTSTLERLHSLSLGLALAFQKMRIGHLGGLLKCLFFAVAQAIPNLCGNHERVQRHIKCITAEHGKSRVLKNAQANEGLVGCKRGIKRALLHAASELHFRGCRVLRSATQCLEHMVEIGIAAPQGEPPVGIRSSDLHRATNDAAGQPPPRQYVDTFALTKLLEPPVKFGSLEQLRLFR